MGRLAEDLSPIIQQIRPWHRSIARAAATGMRPSELASAYGYSNGQISRILGSPLFKAEVARIEAQAEVTAVNVRTEMNVLAVRAVEILDREMDPDYNLTEKDRALQVSTSFGILDRTGSGKSDDKPKGELHLHKHLHVDKMSDSELYRDVIDMVEEEDID